MCDCVFFTALLVALLSHLLLVRKIQTCVKLHKHMHTHGWGGEKWFQQKPGMGPRLPSQAARLLIIAIGFESLLKKPRACVHVFKKQCYVSACHLEAFALQFAPTLAPFLSPVLSGIKVPLRGSVAQAWPDLLCHRGRLVSQWKGRGRALVNY